MKAGREEKRREGWNKGGRLRESKEEERKLRTGNGTKRR